MIRRYFYQTMRIYNTDVIKVAYTFVCRSGGRSSPPSPPFRETTHRGVGDRCVFANAALRLRVSSVWRCAPLIEYPPCTWTARWVAPVVCMRWVVNCECGSAWSRVGAMRNSTSADGLFSAVFRRTCDTEYEGVPSPPHDAGCLLRVCLCLCRLRRLTLDGSADTPAA